jgi:hypothetical protein
MEPFQRSAGGDVTSLLRLWSDGDERAFPCPFAYCEPTDWSSDGRVMLVKVRDSRGWDVWTVSAEEGGRIYLLRRNEDQPPREIHVVIGWRTLLD